MFCYYFVIVLMCVISGGVFCLITTPPRGVALLPDVLTAPLCGQRSFYHIEYLIRWGILPVIFVLVQLIQWIAPGPFWFTNVNLFWSRQKKCKKLLTFTNNTKSLLEQSPIKDSTCPIISNTVTSNIENKITRYTI